MFKKRQDDANNLNYYHQIAAKQGGYSFDRGGYA
jgi:hypothetical protein